MKVKQLIAQLNEADPEGDVWVRIEELDGEDTSYFDVAHVESDPAGNVRFTVEYA